MRSYSRLNTFFKNQQQRRSSSCVSKGIFVFSLVFLGLFAFSLFRNKNAVTEVQSKTFAEQAILKVSDAVLGPPEVEPDDAFACRDPNKEKRLEELAHIELTDAQIQNLKYFSQAVSERKCNNEDADRSLVEQLAGFTCEEKELWTNPKKGIYRPGNYAPVPCNQTAWIEGDWHAWPMSWHCCNKDTGLIKCPGTPIVTPHYCPHLDALSGTCEDDSTLLCPEYFALDHSDCLIYTFGIANQWNFEDFAGGTLGCEIHAFDPTELFLEKHKAHQAPNVNFHYQGLKGSDNVQTEFVYYGKLGGEMKTLDQIWTDLGHKQAGRKINAIKIDCEGCEWDAFVNFAKNDYNTLENVCTIVMEIHVVDTLQMATSEQLKLMADFWHYFIDKLGFRFWYTHANPGGRWDRGVNPLLKELGFDPYICCYEIALHRPGCLPT